MGSSVKVISTFIPTGEEVKKLKNRVQALEDITGTASARSMGPSSSIGVNIVDPLDSTYMKKSSTITRSDNTINLGAAEAGGGAGSGPGQDSATLQRAVQQLVRDELHSSNLRGKEMK